MQDFAAIEIQTANHSPASICAIGIVVVHNGRVTNKIYRKVRPTPNFYAGWAVALHGITYEDTADEPDFVEVWESIYRKFQGLPFIAHNFDYVQKSLKAAFNIYAMNYPKYSFFCTIRSARMLYPELPNHELKEVATHIGFPLADHKNALRNAEAVAAIALQLPSTAYRKYNKTTKTRVTLK